MSKLLGIAFSDLHCHQFAAFNNHPSGTRLHFCLEVLKKIGKIAEGLNIPVFFCGDLYHTPKELSNLTNSSTLLTYQKFFDEKGINFFAISGNHDMSERNSIDRRSPSHLESFQIFKTFYLLDKKPEKLESLDIYGIPYMDNDRDVLTLIKEYRKKINPKKHNILLLHRDLPGAKTPAGFEAKEYHHLNTDLEKLFTGFNTVLVGHIHKPQRLGKNIIMLGSPIHQIKSDEGTEMGCWLIYDDKQVFKSFNEYFPTFITPQEEGGEYPAKDYILEMPKKVIVEKDSNKKEFNLSNSRKKLAKSYLNHKKVEDKRKRKALIKTLKE